MVEKADVLLALLADQGDALRARAEPEHLYTAASIAGFGAVSWGVAALQSLSGTTSLAITRSAVVAAIGVVAVAVLIIIKIEREHWHYARIKTDRATIALKLADLGFKDCFPESFLDKCAGRGDIASAFVVGIAALAAVTFCISRTFAM